MKVLVATDLPWLYEGRMYLRALEREIEKRGIDMDVFVVKTPRRLTLNTKFPFYQLLRTLQSATKISEYDVIHAQFTLPLGLTYTALEIFHKTPVIIHTHGYDVFTLPSEGVGLRRLRVANVLSKLSWKAAARIIAVCKEAKREIMTAGIDERKIAVLYNGVDEEFFSKRRDIDDDTLVKIREASDLVFLTVGNLIHVKNQTGLLVAYSHFLENHPPTGKTMLIICGSGPTQESLRLLVHKLNLADNVTFLGQWPHQRMPELYSIADIFILPSLSEAHPWSLLEAMSCELPVVASNVGGIPETLEDPNLLFDPWNPPEICDTMLYLAQNPAERKHVAARNRMLVLQRFTFRAHVTNLSSIYEQVCQAA